MIFYCLLRQLNERKFKIVDFLCFIQGILTDRNHVFATSAHHQISCWRVLKLCSFCLVVVDVFSTNIAHTSPSTSQPISITHLQSYPWPRVPINNNFRIVVIIGFYFGVKIVWTLYLALFMPEGFECSTNSHNEAL